jgi:hypothetical protein
LETFSRRATWATVSKFDSRVSCTSRLSAKNSNLDRERYARSREARAAPGRRRGRSRQVGASGVGQSGGATASGVARVDQAVADGGCRARRATPFAAQPGLNRGRRRGRTLGRLERFCASVSRRPDVSLEPPRLAGESLFETCLDQRSRVAAHPLTKGSRVDLALDRHHHCCASRHWLLQPGTPFEVAGPHLASSSSPPLAGQGRG